MKRLDDSSLKKSDEETKEIQKYTKIKEMMSRIRMMINHKMFMRRYNIFSTVIIIIACFHLWCTVFLNIDYSAYIANITESIFKSFDFFQFLKEGQALDPDFFANK